MPLLQDTFKVFNEFFQDGVDERIDQEIQLFNAGSRGALALTSQRRVGQFDHHAFLQLPADMIKFRDPATDGALTDVDITQEDVIGVKVAIRSEPMTKSADSWKVIGKDVEAQAVSMGAQWAEQKLQFALNHTVAALRGALEAQAANSIDNSGTPGSILDHVQLNDALALMGDGSASIVAWLTNGAAFHQLMGKAIGNGLDTVAGPVIISGADPGGIGRANLVSDVPALTDATIAASYFTLGLTVGAAEIELPSEPDTVEFVPITGVTNIKYRWQAEGTFNLKLKGLQWDTTGGGAYPNAAALATGANWVKVAASHKHLPGVILETPQV